ncbi:hypothetical protein DPMN_018245 [Dreissena polymorpha]|uniref:Uncharacterized protein n=1 Tax=Dreissena polymorpha TaxID=45954 RepID=A0A9D4NJ08_DREPO|nr:hypothetical protein DPMN_018245 [Dreissena polymorpha]
MITSPPPGGHVFQQTRSFFKLIQDIIKTNVLTKFHEDWTKNVTFKVLTSFYFSHISGHVFQQTGIISILTEFHKDQTINVNSRSVNKEKCHVFQATGTIFKFFHDDLSINVASSVLTRKNATTSGSHAFQQTRTIFKLIQSASPPDGQPNGTIFKLVQYFIDNEDRTISVASRVLTRQMLTPHDSHYRQRTKGDHKSSP